MIEAGIELDLSPLIGLQKQIVRKIVRKAMNKASKIVRDKAKSNANSIANTGHLAKSFGVKVRTYKTTVVAIVGPRSKYVKELGVYTRGKRKGEARRYRPSAILHLLEKGSKRSKALPVLAPAMAETRSTYTNEVTNLIKLYIAQELNR